MRVSCVRYSTRAAHRGLCRRFMSSWMAQYKRGSCSFLHRKICLKPAESAIRKYLIGLTFQSCNPIYNHLLLALNMYKFFPFSQSRMATTKVFSSIVLTSLVCLLVDGQNTFVNPPSFLKGSDYSQNDVWSLGSSQLVQWSTDFPSYNIVLWQENRTEASGAVAGTSIFGTFRNPMGF